MLLVHLIVELFQQLAAVRRVLPIYQFGGRRVIINVLVEGALDLVTGLEGILGALLLFQLLFEFIAPIIHYLL